MDHVRVGVIGAGFMGGLHARAVAESGFGTLVAVADPDLARAQGVAALYDVAAYADYAEMLEREELYAVVATPETMHREPVVMAAARGCAVFVEKPIAASLEDADAMIAACEDAGVPLDAVFGHILRFEPAYARIQQAVEGGMIGRFLTAYGAAQRADRRRRTPGGGGRR